MALLTKKEFSELCGIRTKDLSVYIQRKKVIVNNEMIDDTNEINRGFRTRCLNKPKRQVEPVAKSEFISVAISQAQPKNLENDEFSRQNTTVTDRALKKMDLDAEKKQKEIERLDQEMRIARLQEEKFLGKLIPTDLVKNLFAQHFKSVTLTFKQAADLIAIEFGKKAKIARNDQAELRGQMVTIINRAIEDGITESKRTLAHIVHEYSQTRK
ncbi:MAG TPA: hypothetical protein VGQ59_03430 [Cyclobacteriaceae bacterium]|jgi:hypothetical protein|nr:hypothetical protein [Cyclobacteriaceae bacterium]